MDIISSATLFIIFLAILLLGGEVGLLSRFYKNSIKEHLKIVAIYAFALIIIIAILSPFYIDIVDLASSSFFFYIAIAIFSLIFGVLCLYLWDKNKDYDKGLKTALYLGFIPVSFPVSIVCVATLAPRFSFVLSGITLTLNMFESGIIVGFVFAIIMIFVYFTADFVEDYLEMHYSVIFGGVMVVLAFVFIAIAFLLPNITNAISSPVTELTLISAWKIAAFLLVAIILMGIGVLYNKKHNRLV